MSDDERERRLREFRARLAEEVERMADEFRTFCESAAAQAADAYEQHLHGHAAPLVFDDETHTLH